MLQLQTETASTRTEAEVHELLNLPQTLVVLEQKIQKLAEQLGSQEFRELSGTTGTSSSLIKFTTWAEALLWSCFLTVSTAFSRYSGKVFDVSAGGPCQTLRSKGRKGDHGAKS